MECTLQDSGMIGWSWALNITANHGHNNRSRNIKGTCPLVPAIPSVVGETNVATFRPTPTSTFPNVFICCKKTVEFWR